MAVKLEMAALKVCASTITAGSAHSRRHVVVANNYRDASAMAQSGGGAG